MANKNPIDLNFMSPVLLFGASAVTTPVMQMLKRYGHWPAIAADGGVDTALSWGFMPQAVIGDMDSVDSLGTLPESVCQFVLTGQSDTDLEKSLKLIIAPLIVGVGFMDGRFDHSLSANNFLISISFIL